MEKFDAFISYSREYYLLASAIHSGLEKYAKEKNSLRAMRVYLDTRYLPVNDDLDESLKTALRNSDFLILIATPEAVNSKWVQQELDYFYQFKKSTKNIFIVLAKGEIVWNRSANNFDKDLTTAFPVTENRLFEKEPKYIDARWMLSEPDLTLSNENFRTVISNLAAAIRNISPDLLEGEYLKDSLTNYKRRKNIASLTTGIGFFLGSVMMLFIAQSLVPKLGFLWATVTSSLALSIAGSLFFRLGRKVFWAFNMYTLVLVFIYCFATIRPFNDNIFDVLMQMLLIILAFTGIGYAIGFFDKAAKQNAVAAFSAGGILASILWFLFTPIVPVYADFPIYQTPWLLTRISFLYDLLNTSEFYEIGKSGYPYIVYVPLMIGITIGSLFFVRLEAGKNVGEVRTLHSRVQNLRKQVRPLYVRTGLIILMSLLTGYLIYQHSNWHLKKTAVQNISAKRFGEIFSHGAHVNYGTAVNIPGLIFNCANTLEKSGYTNEAAELKKFGAEWLKDYASSNSLFWDADDNICDIVTALKKANASDSIITGFLTEVKKTVKKGGTSDSLALAKAYWVYGDSTTALKITSDISRKYQNAQLTDQNVSEWQILGIELYTMNREQEAKRYLNIVFNNGLQNSGLGDYIDWYNDDAGEATWNLGYWSKTASQNKYNLRVTDAILNTVSKRGLITELDTILANKEYRLNGIYVPVLTNLAKHNNPDAAMYLFEKYFPYFSHEDIYETIKIFSRQRNMKAIAQLKKIIKNDHEIDSLIANDYSDNETKIVYYYLYHVAFEDFDYLDHNLSKLYPTERIRIYFAMADVYKQLGKDGLAEDALARAWYDMHKKSGRIALFCSEIKDLSIKLMELGKYTASVAIADECDNKTSLSNYSPEEIIEAYRAALDKLSGK